MPNDMDVPEEFIDDKNKVLEITRTASELLSDFCERGLGKPVCPHELIPASEIEAQIKNQEDEEIGRWTVSEYFDRIDLSVPADFAGLR